MDILALLLAPLSIFAFNAGACAFVALVFSVFTFLPAYSNGSRIAFGVAAVAWWVFTWTEATTRVQSNIRVDLVIFGPIYLIAAAAAIWQMIAGLRRKASAQTRDDSKS